jgi:hypothetical protein
MSSFWENIIAGGISGVVSGAVVGLALYLLQRRIENNDRVNVDLNQLKRRLPSDVLAHIKPGVSWSKVRETLGEPDYTTDSEYSEFMDDDSGAITTNSYLYNFLNANLKITTTDNVAIDSVSVFITGNEKKKYNIQLPFPLDNGQPGLIGEVKLDANLIEHMKHHMLYSTAREMTWGIETYAGWATNYLSYSYFGYFAGESEPYRQRKDANLFLGETIDGVCISRIERFAPLISIYM